MLSSSSATEQERLEALKYLGHWVGDVHQPLHVSFPDDRGGNNIGVSGGLCSWDLHAVWDSCILEEGLSHDPHSIARDLLDQVTDEDRATWRASRPIDWAPRVLRYFGQPEGPILSHRLRLLVRHGNEHWTRASPRRWS